MPARLDIFPDQRLVLSTFTGMMDDDAILAHGPKIKAHPDFHPEYNEIVDFSGVTDVRISSTMLHKLARSESIFSPESRHAVIAPGELTYQIAHMYQIIAERSRNLIVVRSLDEACRFVNARL